LLAVEGLQQIGFRRAQSSISSDQFCGHDAFIQPRHDYQPAWRAKERKNRKKGFPDSMLRSPEKRRSPILSQSHKSTCRTCGIFRFPLPNSISFISLSEGDIDLACPETYFASREASYDFNIARQQGQRHKECSQLQRIQCSPTNCRVHYNTVPCMEDRMDTRSAFRFG
jgi:hypothetical protein